MENESKEGGIVDGVTPSVPPQVSLNLAPKASLRIKERAGARKGCGMRKKARKSRKLDRAAKALTNIGVSVLGRLPAEEQEKRIVAFERTMYHATGSSSIPSKPAYTPVYRAAPILFN